MSRGWQDIRPQELEQLLTDDHSFQLVDVRNPDEYGAGAEARKHASMQLPKDFRRYVTRVVACSVGKENK